MNSISPLSQVDPETKRYWRARYLIAYPVQSFALTVSFTIMIALALGQVYSLVVHRPLPFIPCLLGLSLGAVLYRQDRRWAMRMITKITKVSAVTLPVGINHTK